MNTDKSRLQGKHGELTDIILKAYFDVCNDLGGGFLESVYHAALEFALVEAGLEVVSQAPISVYFRQKIVAEFRADFVVEGKVLLELKAGSLDRSHFAQVLNYLKSTPLEWLSS